MSGSDHDHTPITEGEASATYHQLLGTALRELLIEKGVFTAAEVRDTVERMDARIPARGAAMVARAWVDPGYKARLLSDGSAAAEELGIEVGATLLMVVENTPVVHNLIVCTLCSCYPRAVLGLPPAWYKSMAYRARAVREPRALLAEFGTTVPDEIEVRVHDSTAELRYLVLPLRPEGATGLGEEALAGLVGRDAMIGVATVSPAEAT